MVGSDTTAERVLVVDDENDIIEIVTYTLENSGFTVETASNGEDALTKAADFSPDLILLDIMIPRINGFDVCKQLKNSLFTGHIPVIMFSAKKEIDDKVRAAESGADDYIQKPFNRNELLSRIKMVLSRNKMQRERNPLTGLPGNVAIETIIRKALESKQPFAVAMVDIDNFKPFNDKYGYSKGDDAIKTLAHCLITAVQEEGSKNDFIGHIGGDDFTVILKIEEAEKVLGKTIELFTTLTKDLFDPEDIAKGYYSSKDRAGNPRQYNTYLDITIGRVDYQGDEDLSYNALVDKLTETKSKGKTMAGSVVVIDRRKLPIE